MGRSRLGVALVLPEPVRSEISGLRRAMGCPSLETQPPHVTLVPPVNVRTDEIETALDLVQEVCARSMSLMLRIGPVATFSPVSPVVYLSVHGPDVEHLRELRRRVMAGPLVRKVSYDYVPHCTIHEDVAPDAISAALASLEAYRNVVRFDRLDVLRQEPDRVWRTLASFSLGPAPVRGRGSVEVRFHVSASPGPGAGSLLDHADELAGVEPWTIEARATDGTVVAAASGRLRDGRCLLDRLIVETQSRSVGIGDHLLTEVLTFAGSKDSDCVELDRKPSGWVGEWLERRAFQWTASGAFTKRVDH